MSEAPENQVNIEEIMQQIRGQILAKKANLAPESELPFTISGERLPPEYYEHLYHVRLAYDQLQVKVQVSRSSVPLIGPILQRLRAMVHGLVVFYVNQVAAQQISVNTHLLGALDILAQEIEQMPEASSSTMSKGEKKRD